MVRFKVIKGSQLLLTAAAVVLALVIGALAINYALTEKAAPVSTRASLVENAEMEEAKTDLVFASVGMSSGALALDPALAPGQWRELTDEEAALLEQE